MSWLVWAGYQVYPERTELPWTIYGNFLFFFAAWQVLFFTAIVIGYHRDRIGQAVPDRFRGALLGPLASALSALVLLYVNSDRLLMTLQALRPDGVIGGYSISTDLVDGLFAKATLAPGRSGLGGCLCVPVPARPPSLWVPLRRGLGWLLLPFGQNALYAYSAHVWPPSSSVSPSPGIDFDLARAARLELRCPSAVPDAAVVR